MGGKNIHKALLASVYLMAATRVNEATASGYGFQLQKSSARAFTFSTHNGQAVGVKRDCLDAALNAGVITHAPRWVNMRIQNICGHTKDACLNGY
jgi:hypothetical protein